MLLRTLLFLWFATATASAAPFSPDPLRITVPSRVQLNGSEVDITIPFTVSGAPAEVSFLVYTRKESYYMKGQRSGHLGWHYVNRIDTCVYVSPPMTCDIGNHEVTWDFQGVPGGTSDGVPYTGYVYYFWGYDASSPGKRATRFISPRRFAGAHVLTFDMEGQPMANPIIMDGLPASFVSDTPARVTRNRWTLGGDPEDITLLQTITYQTESEACRIACDYAAFYALSRRPGEYIIRKWWWVPNGEAVLRTEWGNDGESVYPGPEGTFLPTYGGVASDGADRLFFPYIWPTGSGYEIPGVDVGIAEVNAADGSLVRARPLDGWFGPPDAVYSPHFTEYRDGMLWASSPASCLVQMVDPFVDDDTRFLRWENRYGDGIWDKAGQPDYDAWACHGSDAPPNPGNLAVGKHHFSLFPATGLETASFGGFGPDGTGLGYFPLHGLADGEVYGLKIVDNGSNYDGIYYAGATTDGDSAGVWHRGYDCAGGKFTGWFEHYWPREVVDPRAGEVLRAGERYTITWRLSSGRVNIEFSSDGGATWTAIADTTKTYYYSMRWSVPAVNSDRCLIRATDLVYRDETATSELFTIEGPVSVAEDIPRVIGLHPNTPNPFNPSTTLSFTLPAPGNVSLTVYDVMGRKVTELAREFHSAGEHSVVWNAKGCASGVYFAVLKSGGRTETRKMLLVR